MTLNQLSSALDEELMLNDYQGLDYSLNGLQVGASDRPIRKVALAVDACQASIDQATKLGCDLLFVHHGLFWGRPLALIGPHYNRIKTLLDNDCGLYAAHLPLDAHPVLGNNAQIGFFLNLENLEGFDKYKGKTIGFKGSLPSPLGLDEIEKKFGTAALEKLDFGPKEIRTVAVVSGSAADDLDQAIDEKVDLFITGEASHITYHQALEAKINVLCLGHYYTETFGVKAVGKALLQKFGLECVFIDIPTGL